jgi:hypothetical protein
LKIGEKEWNDHAQLTGQVMLAWSRTTYQLLRVFTHLTGLGAPLAETLFFSHASDASQRKLLISICEAVALAEEPKAQLRKLLGRLNDAAAARNVAAHSIFGVTLFDEASGARGPKVVPVLGQHVDRRRKADVDAQFREAILELARIFDDLDTWLANTQFPERMWGHPPFIGGVSPLGVPESRKADGGQR